MAAFKWMIEPVFMGQLHNLEALQRDDYKLDTIIDTLQSPASSDLEKLNRKCKQFIM